MIFRSGHKTAASGREARHGDQGAVRRAAACVSRARMLAVAGVLVTFAIGAAVAMASRTKQKAATPYVACIVINPGLSGNRTLKLRSSQCRSNEQQITWPPAGSRGAAGLTGPAGPKGPRGPQGPKGISNSQTATPGVVNSVGDQYSTSDRATSTCPPGTTLLGGGAVSSPNSAIEESQPYGANGWSALAIKLTPGSGAFGVIVTAVCTE